MTRPAKSEQELQIERDREATGAIPVVLNKIPKWALAALRRAQRRDRDGGVPFVSPALYLINDPRWTRLLDHTGSSTYRGPDYSGPSFVTEPYADDTTADTARAFADWLGCSVHIGGPSWWYPGSTTRIEFYPRS